MLADVCDFHHIRVQTGALGGLAEGGLVHAGRAGADDHARQVVFMDGVGDQLLSALGAHILVIRGVNHARFALHRFGDRLYVDGCRNVAAAPANKYADSLHIDSSPLFAVLAHGGHKRLLRDFVVELTRKIVGL